MNIRTIQSITPKGSFDSKFGLLYSFGIVFEDGSFGDANAKSQSPAYKVGDQVAVEQNGEHNGIPKLKINKDLTKVAGGAPVAGPDPSQMQRPIESNGRECIHGATVGFSVKAALDLLTEGVAYPERIKLLNNRQFWLDVREVASDVIRVSQALETGNLAKSISERSTMPQAGRSAPNPTETWRGANSPHGGAVRPVAGPGGSVALDPNQDDDIPF